MKRHLGLLLLLAACTLGKASAQQNEKLNISGHIATAYEYNDDSDTDSFAVKRAWLEAKGNLTPLVEYRLLLDFAVQNAVGKPSILDAWAKFHFHDAFTLQVGQFKLPLTMCNTISPLKLETINSPQIVGNFLGSRVRGLGIAAQGVLVRHSDFTIADYYIGLVNGNGANTADNDHRKDFVGRITGHITDELSIAGSFYNGSLLTATDEHIDNNRIGAGIEYKSNIVTIRSEYMAGDVNGLESEGAYILASYRLSEKVQPVASYDYFRLDKDGSDLKTNNFIIGLNYNPMDCVMLQANYTLRHKTDALYTDYSDRNIFCLQCVVKF